MSSSLPLEIFAEIAEHLDDADKLSLSLASKSFCTFLLPLLYTNLYLQDSQCITKLRFLISRPHLSRFVRQLVLEPSNSRRSAQKHLAAEIELAKAVELLAPNLSSLEKMIWNGLEIPDDRLWEALRKCCPQLKTVGANIGTKPIDPNSQLFAFNDLEGFWLSSQVRDVHYSPNHQQLLGTQGEKLPSAFWEMIIGRSPNLKSLTLGHRGISLHSRRALDVMPITGANWPELVSLRLENCRLDEEEGSGEEASLQLFGNWISSHQTLRYLSVHGLPELRYRQLLGNLQSLGCAVTVPPGSTSYSINSTIEELVLTDEPYDARTFCVIPEYVGSLERLNRLSLWMDFSTSSSTASTAATTITTTTSSHSSSSTDINLPNDDANENIHDHIRQLRKVVERCPDSLEKLTIICSTRGKETFELGDVADILQSQPHETESLHEPSSSTPISFDVPTSTASLSDSEDSRATISPLKSIKSFELWKSHRPGDPPLSSVAETLFHQNPTLEEVTLKIIHGHRRKRSESIRAMQTGVYRAQRVSVTSSDAQPGEGDEVVNEVVIVGKETVGKWVPAGISRLGSFGGAGGRSFVSGLSSSPSIESCNGRSGTLRKSSSREGVGATLGGSDGKSRSLLGGGRYSTLAPLLLPSPLLAGLDLFGLM